MTLTGDGPASKWQGTLSTEMANVATGSSDISCGCQEFGSFEITTNVKLEEGAPTLVADQLGQEFTILLAKSQVDGTDKYQINGDTFRGLIALSVLDRQRNKGRTLSVSGQLDLSDVEQNAVFLKAGERVVANAEIQMKPNKVVVDEAEVTARTFSLSSGRAELDKGKLSMAPRFCRGAIGALDFRPGCP